MTGALERWIWSRELVTASGSIATACCNAVNPACNSPVMDAKVGDWVVTPRHGKPVEIHALWYNALRVTEDLAQRFGSGPESIYYGELADRGAASFGRQFWNSSAHCLYDVVNGDDRDALGQAAERLHSLIGWICPDARHVVCSTALVLADGTGG